MAEECDLKPVKMIYINLISQNKPSYRGSKNLILIQDSDTNQTWYFFTKAKKYLTKKLTPFLKQMNTTEKDVKIGRFDNSDENKNTQENSAKNSENNNLDLHHQALHRKIA